MDEKPRRSMARKPWSEREIQTLLDMRADGHTTPQICEHLGRSYNSVKNKIQSTARDNEGAVSQPDVTLGDDERFEHATNNDTATITSVSSRIKTPDEALKYGNIDTTIWEIERQVLNSWESASKIDGAITTTTLWQVKLWLRRRAPKHITDGLEALFDRTPARAAKPKQRDSKADPHMLEVSVFDAHFGKLCWQAEKFDTNVAEKVFLNAVDDLLSKTNNWDVERILFPIGNDFFHVDNWQGTTTRGTKMDSDRPFAQVFEAGTMAIVHAVERCLDVAPVELLWVPGNHDASTSWYMTRFLAAWFRKQDDVIVDNDPRPRKYRHYGVNLIGFTHGNEEQHRDLPAIMAAEVPELWANSRWREFHLGHYHRAKQLVIKNTDEFSGVRVRVLPSLSGTDSWHFAKGYVENKRAAEAYLWSKAEGYSGHFSSNIK